jgi:HlyD family type I secretion membrane fusion protein
MSSRANHTQPRTLESHGLRGYALLGCATVLMGFGGFLAWAATAPLDSAAIARGEIEVESANKPIQHLEGGLVAAIYVKEAQAVRKGAALFKVQSSATIAQRDSLRVQLDAAMGTFARLVAEQGERAEIRFPATLIERKDQPHVAKVMADQRQQFLDRKIASAERISILNSRLDEAIALHGGKIARVGALKSELASLEAQMARVRPILKDGWFPRNKFEELVRQSDKLGGDLQFTEAEVTRQAGSIAGLKLQIKHARQAKLEKISSELAETNTRIADLSARLEALEERMHRAVVRAPQDGIIQNIKVRAEGEVVQPGFTLAEIVPVADKLVVGAKVSPNDIDSIRVGRQADLRVAAFSASRTPPIKGRVVKVSADTMKDEASGLSFYKVRIEIDRDEIAPKLAERLVPGMPVDTIISKGERTMLQYLSDPLVTAFAKSMREQ